jgi:N-acetylglucosaminyldiphosphoundecaprenol N-acetyl-beta-D-mannosaminyltransferase
MDLQLDGKQFDRFSLLGLPVNALTKHDLVELVEEAVQNHKRYIIGHHNLHSLYVVHHKEGMRKFYSQADFAHLDGMGPLLIGRLLGLPLTRRHRTGYLDLLPLLVRRASRAGWRIFYLGSRPGIAEKAINVLRAQHPELQIHGRHGYFDSTPDSHQNSEVLTEIRRFDPQILLVGMGMPLQEIWIRENLDRIQANAVFCCGALMDYIAGASLAPPRWLGPIGLEWLYRMITEPRRLWRRYLAEPWFVMKVLAKVLVNP